MRSIDSFLNNITMYRLILYDLIVLLTIAEVFNYFKILHYSFFSLILSTCTLILVCWVTNTVFAKVFNAHTNVESVYISALILTLIINPISSIHDLPFLFFAGLLAMSSKYMIAFKGKHIFNPVAFGVAATAAGINQSASWWIGSLPMLPFVFAGGLLIVRKIQRSDLVFSFIFTTLVTTLILGALKGSDLVNIAKEAILNSSLFFFAFVMLTEPLTTPPTKILQIAYGSLVGFLFAPQIHIGSIFLTPELALVVGNIFSYIVSPKERLILSLKEKNHLADDIYEFIFSSNSKINYKPGQYLEWTLGHSRPDSRGNRRFITIASSPTEEDIRIGIKFYNNASSFKKSLQAMNVKNNITACHLSGDFVLPNDPEKKLVFIAGGIGITPFRSMIKSLLDKNEKRTITIFYANQVYKDIVYKDIFDDAHATLGTKIVYALSDIESIPINWKGKIGHINEIMIKEEVPDYKARYYYVSGPRTMVISFEKILKGMDINKKQIKVDFFPGFV